MNEPLHDERAALMNAEISPNLASHQEVTPLINNKSEKANCHGLVVDDLDTRPVELDATDNVCVNLENSKFSSNSATKDNHNHNSAPDKFLRNYSPFDEN
jgi:hypothetical protein